jgi:molybdopterin synthase catalytic subunit
MRVRVLFFGVLKDLVGKSADSVELAKGATVGDLLGFYSAKVPGLAKYTRALATSVNQQYAVSSTELREDDEVGLLPPVQEDTQEQRKEHVGLVRERIGTQALLESMKLPADGAIAAFEGIVRDNSRGRRTLYLDYEAYEPMALAELERLVAEALEKFTIRDAAVVHRLGRLDIGETSVLIVVASAHRAAAFDACRWMIDTLKKRVPIWKKEHFEDGAVWADGEPFPQEIR